MKRVTRRAVMPRGVCWLLTSMQLFLASLATAQLPVIVQADQRGTFEAQHRLTWLEREVLSLVASGEHPDREIIALVRGWAAAVLWRGVSDDCEAIVIFSDLEHGKIRRYVGARTDRYYESALKPGLFDQVREHLKSREFHALRDVVDGPDETRRRTGQQRQILIRANRERGRRVVVDKFEVEAADRRQIEICDFLAQLPDEESMSVEYVQKWSNQGMRVVFANTMAEVLAIRLDGDDIRVAVRFTENPYGEETVHGVLDRRTLGPALPMRFGGRRHRRVLDRTLKHVRTSTNGHWLLGYDEEESELVCFHSGRKTLSAVGGLEGRFCIPRYFLSEENLFVVERQRIASDRSDFCYFDPTAGRLSKVPADEEWLFPDIFGQDLPEQLQFVVGANRVAWVAVSWGADSTAIKKYDLSEGIRPLEVVALTHGLRFQTSDMYVHEKQRRIYVVYHGQLLSFPFLEKGK